MKNTFRMIALICVCLLSANVRTAAQDFHLSQAFASPSNLNPALTGVMEGNLRFVANYRAQWFQVASYTTYAFSIDGNIARYKMNDNLLGVGGSFYQDIEESSALSNTQAAINVAYNQKITSRPLQYIGIGMQAAILKKQVDLSNAIYGTSFESGINTDPVQSGPFPGPKLDLGTGFSWFLATRKHSVSVGAALYHISRPDFGILSEDRLFRKWTGYASAEISISDYVALNPTVLFLLQGPSKELITGLFAKMSVQNTYSDLDVYFGLLFRGVAGVDRAFGGDAVIPAVRVAYKGILAGFSYDFTISKLAPYNKNNGGPEISLIVELPFEQKKKGSAIKCPKF